MWRITPERYGWVIVMTLSVTETVTWGIVYYGFPVFLRPMEQDLGASRVAVTGAVSVGLGVSALAALPVGRWIDRHGARGLMTVGSCLATLLTYAWARVETLPALYAVWFGMGVAMAATLYEPAFAVVVSWFTRGRDRALLTVTLAAGLASTIFMPIEAWLLSRVGWRDALTILTVVLGVITIPMHAALLRRSPAGAAHPRVANGGPTGPARGVTLDAARRTAVFWVLSAAFFVSNFATAALSTHLIPYLVGRGYSPTIAATVMGWMGAMQLPGRVLFVPIADAARARPRYDSRPVGPETSGQRWRTVGTDGCAEPVRAHAGRRPRCAARRRGGFSFTLVGTPVGSWSPIPRRAGGCRSRPADVSARGSRSPRAGGWRKA